MPALVFRPFLALGAAPPRSRPRPVGGTDGAVAAETPLSPREADQFRRALLPHLDAAYGFARALTRDPTAAEDLVQEAYLKAYRAFRGYRGGEPKAWLFAIVRTCFLSWARSHRPWTELTVVEDEIADEAETPEGLLLRQADDAAVRAAIDALPDPFREAIVLRELQEMNYRQIAEITGVPIGTVMSRLARARRLLAADLGGRP